MIAYVKFNKSKPILSETAPSSYVSKAILQHTKNEDSKIQLAISAGLTCLIRELWSNLTKTTRRDLSGNIVVLKARLQRLKNEELNINQLIDTFSEAVRERDLFLETNRNNPEVLSRIKEIYLEMLLIKRCRF